MRLIIILLALFLISCKSEEKEEKQNKSPRNNVEEIYGLVEQHKNDLIIHFLIDSLRQVKETDTLPLGQGLLVPASLEDSPPVQHSGGHFYIMTYKGNMLSNHYEWTKLMKYQKDPDTLLEVWYSEEKVVKQWIMENKHYIYFDSISSNIVSVDLKNGKTKEITKLDTDVQREMLFASTQENVIVFWINPQGHLLSTNINEPEEEVLIAEGIKDFAAVRDRTAIVLIKPYQSESKEKKIQVWEEGKLLAERPFEFYNVQIFWVSDDHFLILQEDQIVKLNRQLETIDSLKIPFPYIIKVTELGIFGYYQERQGMSGKRFYFLTDKDLKSKKTLDLSLNGNTLDLIKIN